MPMALVVDWLPSHAMEARSDDIFDGCGCNLFV